MHRVRIAFALLVVCLAVPMWLLIDRALGGVQIEREAQNRAVAERVFDEMERALSDFLRAEDERPPAQYSFYYTPDGAPSNFRVRSPLADTPEKPFVVGYFQIDADGKVTTPLLPLDRAAAIEAGDFEVSLATEGTASDVLAAAARITGADGVGAARFPPLDLSQAPGTTERVDKAGDPDPKKGAEGFASTSDAYDVLQQLNRGARERAERAQKVTEEHKTAYAPSPAVFAEEGEPEDRRSEVFGDVARRSNDADDSGVAGLVADTPAAATAGRGGSAAPRELPRSVPVRSRLDDLPGARERLAALPVRVSVDPFHLQPGSPDSFVLLRTVVLGERAIRQGIVIDVDALLGALREHAIVEGALEGAALELAFAADVIGGDRPRYRHRFGEPFDSLTVDLALAPLGNVAGAGAVFLLSALSLGVMGIALFALYRMVAVTVAFAERRANFVAAVSHELKTPLTAIRMYGEMLRDGLVPDEGKKNEYYRSITAESERLSRLINNVLEFSRIERGKREMDLRVGDVKPALREAIELLEPHAEQKGQRLVLEMAEDLPAVSFEHDALLQVLFNLIDNALKYAAGARDPVIEVRAEPAADGVEISVRDHGPGVSPEHAARILEPFYRGENELTRKAQGTGIGLSLVKGLTEEMGAKLRVGNASDGGFRAVLELAAGSS